MSSRAEIVRCRKYQSCHSRDWPLPQAAVGGWPPELFQNTADSACTAGNLPEQDLIADKADSAANNSVAYNSAARCSSAEPQPVADSYSAGIGYIQPPERYSVDIALRKKLKRLDWPPDTEYSNKPQAARLGRTGLCRILFWLLDDYPLNIRRAESIYLALRHRLDGLMQCVLLDRIAIQQTLFC